MPSPQHDARSHVQCAARHQSAASHVYPPITEELTKARSPPPTIAKPKTWLDALDQPGGLMNLQGTFQAIFAMQDVEYPESAESDWINRRPRRYGKHGERCSTVKYIFKHVGYRVRMLRRDLGRLCRDT